MSLDVNSRPENDEGMTIEVAEKTATDLRIRAGILEMCAKGKRIEAAIICSLEKQSPQPVSVLMNSVKGVITFTTHVQEERHNLCVLNRLIGRGMVVLGFINSEPHGVGISSDVFVPYVKLFTEP